MKQIYQTLKENDLIGENLTLQIINPIIRKPSRNSSRRYFLAKCIICNEEQLIRYDALRNLKGCKRQCQNREDITSYLDDSFTIVKYIGGKNSLYECKCTNCGKIFIKRNDHIKRLVNKGKGCGCVNVIREHFGKRIENTLERLLFNKYNKGAQNRGYCWELNYEQFISLIYSPCHYCGEKHSNKFTNTGTKGQLLYNGIDRRDNTIGYQINNCLPACKICNLAKHAMSYESFLNWIERIKQHEII